MFNPPQELHTRFEEALAEVRGNLGKEYGKLVGGEEYFAKNKIKSKTPANTRRSACVFSERYCCRCK